MKSFKHSSDLSEDVNIQTLKNKFGMEGYGRYLTLLELFARADNRDLKMCIRKLNDVLHSKTKTLKPFLKHCQNILITFPEHSENIPETFWEHSENILIMRIVKHLESGDAQETPLINSLTNNLTVKLTKQLTDSDSTDNRKQKTKQPPLPFLKWEDLNEREKLFYVDEEFGAIQLVEGLTVEEIDNIISNRIPDFPRSKLKEEIIKTAKLIKKRGVDNKCFIDLYRLLGKSRYRGMLDEVEGAGELDSILSDI